MQEMTRTAADDGVGVTGKSSVKFLWHGIQTLGINLAGPRQLPRKCARVRFGFEPLLRS